MNVEKEREKNSKNKIKNLNSNSYENDLYKINAHFILINLKSFSISSLFKDLIQ